MTRLRVDDERVGEFLTGLPPARVLTMGMPVWWLKLTEDYPANTCLDSALILRGAFAVFDVPAEPICVRLRVEHGETGQVDILGTDAPHCDGDQLVGHVGLWLPAAGLFVDQTAQQFPVVRREDWMPVMIPAARLGGLTCRRGPLRLTYTPVPEPANRAVFDHPMIRTAAEHHRRTAVNLASSMIALLRRPAHRDRALASPHPRLHALLRRIGDAPATVDADHNVRFVLPGTDGIYLDSCGT